MRISLIFLLLVCAVINTSAQIRVPNSTSPDGKTGLYYRHIPTTITHGAYQFWFLAPKSLSLLSDQLVPDVRGKVLGADPAVDSNWDGGLLFEDIGADVEAIRHSEQRNGAFSYFVAWSPDSRWVSIEGGQHKFWHLMIYHLIHGRFERIELPPNLSFIEYYRTHSTHPNVKKLGATKKIPARDYDPPKVCWLRNGIVAVGTYSFLLRDNDYREDSFPFYFLDCRAKPRATILGFCR